MKLHGDDPLDLRPRQEELRKLREWKEATLPIIAALAIYGDAVNVEALVKKARSLNEHMPQDEPL